MLLQQTHSVRVGASVDAELTQRFVVNLPRGGIFPSSDNMRLDQRIEALLQDLLGDAKGCGQRRVRHRRLLPVALGLEYPQEGFGPRQLDGDAARGIGLSVARRQRRDLIDRNQVRHPILYTARERIYTLEKLAKSNSRYAGTPARHHVARYADAFCQFGIRHVAAKRREPSMKLPLSPTVFPSSGPHRLLRRLEW